MKYRKLIRLCIIAALILTGAAGCGWTKYAYPSAQSLDDVEKVEICQYDYDALSPKMASLMVLDENVADALLTEITQLDSYQSFGEPSFAYGEVVIYYICKGRGRGDRAAHHCSGR